VVRGENSATRKAIPNKASNPNNTSVHIPVGASPPVTGITPGVPSTITVAGTITVSTGGGTRVPSDGTTVSWNFTVCGAAGDPKALKNKAVRITIENKIVLSFIGTPFSNRGHNRGDFYYVLYNEEFYGLLSILIQEKSCL